jgi:hypothetical protein
VLHHGDTLVDVGLACSLGRDSSVDARHWVVALAVVRQTTAECWHRCGGLPSHAAAAAAVVGEVGEDEAGPGGEGRLLAAHGVNLKVE